MGLIRVLSTGCNASSVTFNLMGCPSPPLAIKLVHGRRADFFPKQSCTISISHAVQWGHRRHVFRGRFGGMPVVAKICSDGAQSLLRGECAVYQTLSDLQGSAIPRCYGLFRVGDMADMLLLEDCGESLHSFDGLTPKQRCVRASPCFQPTDRSQGVSLLPRLGDASSPRCSSGSRALKHRQVCNGAAEGGRL